MRSLFLLVILLLPCPLIAAELISEPHAMFYYRLSLDGGGAKQSGHSFGFRMDRADFNMGEMPDQHKLFQQQAVFDFKMSTRGIEGIYLSGNNLLETYRLNNADEAGDEGKSGMSKVVKVVLIGGAVVTIFLALVIADAIEDATNNLDEIEFD